MTGAIRQQPEDSAQEVLAGLVERVTFHNADNGFCVLRTKARGHRDLVTVVGHAAMVSAGEWITASGEWINDRTHGQQFKARFMRTSEPSSIEGIEKTAMIRVRAGIVYALTEAMDDGHCGLPSEALAPLAVELLEVPNALVQTALDLELAEGTVGADTVGGTPCIFLGGLYRAERAIAERFLRITSGKLTWPDIDAGKAPPVLVYNGSASVPDQACLPCRLPTDGECIVEQPAPLDFQRDSPLPRQCPHRRPGAPTGRGPHWQAHRRIVLIVAFKAERNRSADPSTVQPDVGIHPTVGNAEPQSPVHRHAGGDPTCERPVGHHAIVGQCA